MYNIVSNIKSYIMPDRLKAGKLMDSRRGNITTREKIKRLTLKRAEKILNSVCDRENIRVSDLENDCVRISLSCKKLNYNIQVVHFFIKNNLEKYSYISSCSNNISADVIIS